jgi:hypothetical protein
MNWKSAANQKLSGLHTLVIALLTAGIILLLTGKTRA